MVSIFVGLHLMGFTLYECTPQGNSSVHQDEILASFDTYFEDEESDEQAPGKDGDSSKKLDTQHVPLARLDETTFTSDHTVLWI